jgi:hypothetical protein
MMASISASIYILRRVVPETERKIERINQRKSAQLKVPTDWEGWVEMRYENIAVYKSSKVWNDFIRL